SQHPSQSHRHRHPPLPAWCFSLASPTRRRLSQAKSRPFRLSEVDDMKKLLLIALMAPMLASAELTPNRGHFDARVRVANYNPADVVKLTTFYGVSTHIQFAKDESIKDVAVGDDQAWAIVDRGNHLFIKPKARQADTNVT